MAGLFIALFVEKCTACQSHWNPISDGIVFKNELTHADHLPQCLGHKRVEKSQEILEHLMTFRSSISTDKPEQLLSLMCCFFSVC